MVINLLPSEEKAKIKKYKQPPAREIKYTEPERKVEEGKIRKAGVLAFFKQTFQKPKKKPEEEAKKLPEQKIKIIKEEVIFKKAVPKVEFSKPHKVKKESIRVKPSVGFGQKLADWLRSLFARKPKPYKAVTKPEKPKEAEEKKAPEYKPVRLSRIEAEKSTKPRKEEIIQLFTREEKVQPSVEKELPKAPPRPLVEPKPVHKEMRPEKPLLIKEAEKPKIKLPEARPEKRLMLAKPSLWERMKILIKRLFSRKKKVKVIPLEVVPPKEIIKHEPVIKEEKKEEKEEKVKDEFVYKPFVKVPEPPPVEEQKEVSIPKIDFKEKLLSSRFKEEPAKKSEVPPPPPPLPEKEVKEEPRVPKVPEIRKEEPVVSKEPAEKEKPREKPAKKPSRISAWLSRFINKLKSLFSRKKPEVMAKREEFKLPKVSLAKEEFIAKSEKKENDEFKVPPPPPPPLKESVERPKEEVPVPKAGDKFTVPPLPPLPKKEKIKEEAVKEVPPTERGLKFTKPKISETEPALTSFDVNLVPEEMVERKIPRGKFIIMGVALVVSILLAGGIRFGLEIYYQNIIIKIEEINLEISELDQEINSYEKLQDNVKIIKNKVDNVRTALNTHIYWSKFLTELEKYTIPEVYYTGLTADVNGSVSLSVIGKSYEAAAKQLTVFRSADDFVSSATISSIKYTGSEVEGTTGYVSFSISLKVLPNVFFYK